MSDKKENKNHKEKENKEKVVINIENNKCSCHEENKTECSCEKCGESKVAKLEEKIKKLQEVNSNLEKQIEELKVESSKAQNSFFEQAKTFQEKAKAKVEEFKNQHKDKLDEEISHIKKFAASKFFKEMTEPWLNLQQAVNFGEKQENPDVKNYVIGFKMLLKQIDSIMESHGLTKIEPKIGDKFNPETMDAISVVENKEKIDMVVEIKKNGFKHHDRVIRPATVVIGK